MAPLKAKAIAQHTPFNLLLTSETARSSLVLDGLNDIGAHSMSAFHL